MAVFISLLRGINVGGNKKILMADLKTLYASLGFTKTQTLLQSGNAVFETDITDPLELTTLIEAAVVKTFGFESRILIRTPDQMKQVMKAHPFSAEQLTEPAKLAVTFLTTSPTSGEIDNLLNGYVGPEQLTCIGQELYVYYPDGLGVTKLSNVFIEKRLKTTGTARNWNTVTKLTALAETFEG